MVLTFMHCLFSPRSIPTGHKSTTLSLLTFIATIILLYHPKSQNNNNDQSTIQELAQSPCIVQCTMCIILIEEFMTIVILHWWPTQSIKLFSSESFQMIILIFNFTALITIVVSLLLSIIFISIIIKVLAHLECPVCILPPRASPIYQCPTGNHYHNHHYHHHNQSSSS